VQVKHFGRGNMCTPNKVRWGMPVEIHCRDGYSLTTPWRLPSAPEEDHNFGKCGIDTGKGSFRRHSRLELEKLSLERLQTILKHEGYSPLTAPPETAAEIIALLVPTCAASTIHNVINALNNEALKSPIYWVARISSLLSLGGAAAIIRIYLSRPQIRRCAVDLGILLHLAVALALGAVTSIWGSLNEDASDSICRIQVRNLRFIILGLAS
jgi:hypothetical protein